MSQITHISFHRPLGLLAVLLIPLLAKGQSTEQPATQSGAQYSGIAIGMQAGPMILGTSSNQAHHLGNSGYAGDLTLRSAFAPTLEVEFKGTLGDIVRDNGAMNAVQTQVRAASVLVNWAPQMSLTNWKKREEKPVGIDAVGARLQRTEIKPFIGLGIGHSDLHRSVDALDTQGRTYHLWNDGTLRDISQFSEQEGQAVILERDYSYETDYDAWLGSNQPARERAVTVPLQAGVQLDLGASVRARMGASAWIEPGTSQTGFGMLQGFFGLDVVLGNSLKRKVTTLESRHDQSARAAQWDVDRDGVSDLIDRCPGTPYDENIEVDLYGCPVDSDGDGFADYRDAEPMSVHPAVDAQGVGLTERQVSERHSMWQGLAPWTGMDFDTLWTSSSSNMGDDMADARWVKAAENSGLTPAEQAALLSFRKVVSQNNAIYIDPVAEAFAAAENGLGTIFRVQVGAFKSAQAPALKAVFAGWDILALAGDDGMTHYVSHSFETAAEAAAHRRSLSEAGFEGVFVAAYHDGKRVAEARPATVIGTTGIRFRVQIGALQDEVSTEGLNGYLDLGEVDHNRDAGWHRYFYGTFEDLGEAERALIKVKTAGFDDAFLVGEMGGKTLPVGEALMLLGER